MIEFTYLIFAICIGLISGLVFFGGLWLTTRRLATLKYPALWLPLSFFARTATEQITILIALTGVPL